MKEHKGAMLAIKIVAAVFLLTPLVVMFIYSLADRWISILPEGFTVSYYISILTNPAFLMGIVRGIIISAIFSRVFSLHNRISWSLRMSFPTPFSMA